MGPNLLNEIILERNNMEDVIRLTKAIHHFVRGQLSWNYSIHLLEEIIESDEWLQFLEMDMMLFEMGLDAARRKNIEEHGVGKFSAYISLNG